MKRVTDIEGNDIYVNAIENHIVITSLQGARFTLTPEKAVLLAARLMREANAPGKVKSESEGAT